MLNENAKKLVAALRSGEFKQGMDRLRSASGKFCCLGVACELAAREGIIGPAYPNVHDGYVYGRDSHYLPESVQKWLGFRTHTGSFHDVESGLANMNDRGSTFDAIADKIESEPKGLFVE